MQTEPRANLNLLAFDIARQEGLRRGIGIAQVKEVLALLGIRWRNMDLESAMIEINCLLSRGGKLSEHKARMLAEAESEANEGLEINEEFSREEVVKTLTKVCQEKNVSIEATVEVINLLNADIYEPVTLDEIIKVCQNEEL